MALTPIDIQQKTFGPELRGYNMDEVDDFLDEVVTALKDYDQRVRDAQDRIRALEAELSTRGEDESAISRALVAAQKQADAVLIDARGEASRIREEAQGEVDRFHADRERERLVHTQEIARMRATVADLKRRVSDLSASVSADLDEMDQAAGDAMSDLAAQDELVTDELVTDEPVTGEPGYPGFDHAGVGDGIDPFEVGDVGAFDAGDELEELDELDETDETDQLGEQDEGENAAVVTPAGGWGLDRESSPEADLEASALDGEGDEADDELGSGASDDDDQPDHDPDVNITEEIELDDVHPDAVPEPPSSRRPWERGSS